MPNGALISWALDRLRGLRAHVQWKFVPAGDEDTVEMSVSNYDDIARDRSLFKVLTVMLSDLHYLAY